MNVNLTHEAIEASVKLLEVAVSAGIHIYDAIRSSGELTPEQKHALVNRVEAARAKVAAYEPRDV